MCSQNDPFGVTAEFTATLQGFITTTVSQTLYNTKQTVNIDMTPNNGKPIFYSIQLVNFFTLILFLTPGIS